MLPILAVVTICGFLVLHFTGVLDDLGRRAIQGQRGRSTSPMKRSLGEKETDRRLKVFENYIQNLTKPGEEADDEPGTVREDNSPKD